MMEKNKNVPKIRFKGFVDGWENKEFSTTFLPLNNNTLSRAELNYERGSTKNVHYGDVLIKFGENLDVSKEELPYITNEKIADKYTHLQDGDIVFADAAEDETVGKCTELLNVSNERVVAGLHTIACRPLFTFANGYLGYFLNAPIYHNQLLPLMQGTKVLSISKSAIKHTVVYYPEFEEQKQIGYYFQNIDKLIEANQTKLEKLKNIKKACLEKMFPKKTTTIPEIRFKGFTGEWEVKKFSDIAQTRRGLTYKPSDLIENGIRVLRSSNIKEDAFVISVDDIFVCKNAINIEYVKDNDILITSANGSSRLVGKHAIISGITKNTAVHGGFMLLATATNPYFTNSLMSSAWYSTFINLHVAGGNGAIGNLSKNDLDDEQITVPTDNQEQIDIGNFFKNLDDLISKNEQQLTKLKNIKKACLEKMFVNKEDTL